MAAEPRPACSEVGREDSGAASSWLRNQSAEAQRLFASPETTWEELQAAVQRAAPGADMRGYGVSRAGVTAYTILRAKTYPNLLCTSLSPGFIDTNMSKGFGATLRTIIFVVPPLTFRTYQILPHTNSYFHCLYSYLDLLQ